MLPGFVNGHHHVGLTPVQLGSPDMPLELWFITRMVTRNLNIYLDTLYSAFEMIASGITTVQHIHGWMPGTLSEVEAKAEQVIRAYEDIGMRVSYCYAVRDQNRLVYQADDEFVASLPKELQGPMKRWFERFKLGLDDAMGMFESMHARHNNKPRVKIQLAPANLHWCSDKALTVLSQTSKKYQVPMHMHLLETSMQKEIRLAARRMHRGRIHRPLRYARSAHDAGARRLAQRKGHRAHGGGRRMCVSQLLLQFPASLRHRALNTSRPRGSTPR